MNWHCPKCGWSYYKDGAESATQAFFPAIMRDGVNVNPDRNRVSTERMCMHCGWRGDVWWFANEGREAAQQTSIEEPRV